jgi:hypothetical protein
MWRSVRLDYVFFRFLPGFHAALDDARLQPEPA